VIENTSAFEVGFYFFLFIIFLLALAGGAGPPNDHG
jgi:hypothetical protein